MLPAWWVSHLERDFAEPPFRDLFTTLASRTTVVRYDRPGVGLSDRARTDFRLDDEVDNLGHVIDAIGAPRVALFGVSCGCPAAITYAARHPERVDHLVLYGSYQCGAKLASDELKTAMIGLVRASWGIGAKALADVFAPSITADQAKRMVELHRASASAEMAAALLSMAYRWDISDLLPTLRVPTLVLHRSGDRSIKFDHGRELASRIPNAAFVPLDGDSHLMWIGDHTAITRAVLDFVAPLATSELTGEDTLFRRSGDVWTVAFAGRRSHVKHARGLADLAILLAHPGERIHASQLAGGGEAVVEATHDPVLDDRARFEMRARLATLESLIEEAEARGDARVALRADDERAALLAELRAATGVHGRKRNFSDSAEKARKAVTGRIRDSIDKLRATMPELARHLDESVETGSYCCYAPARPVQWQI